MRSRCDDHGRLRRIAARPAMSCGASPPSLRTGAGTRSALSARPSHRIHGSAPARSTRPNHAIRNSAVLDRDAGTTFRNSSSRSRTRTMSELMPLSTRSVRLRRADRGSSTRFPPAAPARRRRFDRRPPSARRARRADKGGPLRAPRSPAPTRPATLRCAPRGGGYRSPRTYQAADEANSETTDRIASAVAKVLIGFASSTSPECPSHARAPRGARAGHRAPRLAPVQAGQFGRACRFSPKRRSETIPTLQTSFPTELRAAASGLRTISIPFRFQISIMRDRILACRGEAWAYWERFSEASSTYLSALRRRARGRPPAAPQFR